MIPVSYGAMSLVVMCMIGIKNTEVSNSRLNASGNPSWISSLAHHSLPKNQRFLMEFHFNDYGMGVQHKSSIWELLSDIQRDKQLRGDVQFAGFARKQLKDEMANAISR
jgi:hypothetical protein